MHFLLLNPAGKLTYTRDYFCSKVTKAGYAEHPVDLLLLSGILFNAGHRITVIDAIAEKLGPLCLKQRIDALSIDVVIFLTGMVSWKDDFEFLEKIKHSRPRLLLIGLGDIFLEPHAFVNNKWIDAVLLDFTSSEVLEFCNGSDRNFQSISFRRGEKLYLASRQRSSGKFAIPIPRHELFLAKKYSFPFARRLPFATILTDYGCPFRCPFCIYPTLGFKLRELDNAFDELRYIYSLGIRELFVKDQSFGSDRARTIALCQGMRKIGKFSWTCFLRTDIADQDLLREVKESGCHTVLFGVESANEQILEKYKPGVKKDGIRNAFRLCRILGIDTVGIFILGFPQEDKKSCLETIDFALKLKCDFASFNVFVPKIDTPLRKEMIAQHLVDENDSQILDQSGIVSAWHNEYLYVVELIGLRRFALRKFYLRPSYIFKRLLKSLGSIARLKILFKSAFFILRDSLGNKTLR